MIGAAGPVLVLWDVDHTLIDAGGLSRDLYAAAFRAVTGRELGGLAGMAGRTERAILTETLALNGMDGEFPLADYYAALGASARDLVPRMREAGRALPGARESLAALAAQGCAQTLVTGNIPAVAEAKLRAFDLTGHLDLAVGGYGDAHADRAVLVRDAWSRAEAAYGVRYEPRRVVVIGDTPHDVRCALDTGALPVAVATGGSPAATLHAAGAELVLPDLTTLPAALTHKLGEGIS